MYRPRHSPVKSKGIKKKHAVQLCVLIAVCFWLIFQLKRSHDNKKNNEFGSLNAHAVADEAVKFGRKDLQPKLETGIRMHEHTQVQEQEEEEEEEDNKHEEQEEEQEEDKIEENVDDDIEQQQQSDMEIDRDHDEVEIIDEEDKDSENEEKDGENQTENRVDNDEDGSTEHTNEAREEHYKADDASSAVITHHPGNGTSSDNVGSLDKENGSIIQGKDSESTASEHFPNTSTATVTEGFSKNSEMLKSDGRSAQSKTENIEKNSSDPTEGRNTAAE